MIFKSRLIHLIAEGKKTQTRRPAPPGPLDTIEPRWTVGRAYAAQPGRGKPATLHFIVTDIRRETLSDLSFDDARREGFKTRDDFYDYWSDLYGQVDLAQYVWVITFKRDDRDTPRLLAAKISRGDYTDDPALAAHGEPEAISELEHARLHHFSGARDDANRRRPLASSLEELQRACDAIRERVDEENLQDARLLKAIASIEHYAGIAAKRAAGDVAA